MTEEKQNEALGHWLAKSNPDTYCDLNGITYRKSGEIMHVRLFLDFSTSLDSMALIQDAMDAHEFDLYSAEVARATGATWDSTILNFKIFLRATAAQRCEAAVRALGLWSEEQ